MDLAIVGGGITGLTTALALKKQGIDAVVYERAQELNEIGAGVWLQPNAMQVMDWLGLKDQIIAAGCLMDKMEITYPDLQPIKKIDKALVKDKYGNQTVAIHRGRLQRILFDAFAKVGQVELGMDFQEATYQGGKVQIQFDNGVRTVDYLLGADGIKSKVRESLGFKSEYRHSKQLCWRGVSKHTLPVHLKDVGREVWGRNLRFGFSNLSSDEVYFFIVVDKRAYPQDLSKDKLADLFVEFHPEIPRIIQHADRLHKAELIDLKRLPAWHTDQCCLIGDAAHATTPNMGQGAGQGIEDAYVISQLLKQTTNPSDAFKRFESIRRKKVDNIVNTSWTFGKMAHHWLGQPFLKTLMKLTPTSMLDKQMKKLYTLDAM